MFNEDLSNSAQPFHSSVNLSIFDTDKKTKVFSVYTTLPFVLKKFKDKTYIYSACHLTTNIKDVPHFSLLYLKYQKAPLIRDI